MKKKITFFTLHLGYGGVEKAVISLANELSNNYDIEIIATYKLFDNPVFKLNDNIKVKYLIVNNLPLRLSGYRTLLRKKKIGDLIKALYQDYLKKFKFITLIKDTKKGLNLLKKKEKRNVNEVKKCQSDIIISTTPYLNGLVSKYANKDSLKIGWEHSHHHNNKKYINQIKETSKGLDKFIVVSNKLADFYSKILDCEVIGMPNYLQDPPCNFSDLSKKEIITVGRLSEEKGGIDLIKVFNIIHKLDNSIKYHVVGDGQEKNKIENQITKYKLNDFIKMHGYQSQECINDLYTNCSLYIMGSFTEACPLVLAEAMSYGIPCIAFTSAEGANDLIINGVNGYLINKRNFKRMAETVLDCLNDQDKLEHLSKNAIITSKRYLKETAIKEWIKILEENN